MEWKARWRDVFQKVRFDGGQPKEKSKDRRWDLAKVQQAETTLTSQGTRGRVKKPDAGNHCPNGNYITRSTLIQHIQHAAAGSRDFVHFACIILLHPTAAPFLHVSK